MPEFLEVCEKAARRAADVLQAWQSKFTSREKAPNDLVTEADLAAQEQIRGDVLSAFPDHGFLGEETPSVEAPSPPYRWIVDPLDGTTNYVHGLRHYCISVALARGDELVCGAVYDPCSRESFTASSGRGAFLNGQRLRVSGVRELGQALVSASFPAKVQRHHPFVEEFINVLVACQAVRRFGSSALNLCYLAAGRFDAYWANHVKPWDVAAGFLIVREAGGIVTGPDGGTLDLDHPRFVAAATPELHQQLLVALGRVPAGSGESLA